MLLTLRLPGAPAADTIAAVAEVWLAAFKAGRNIFWEETDAGRVRQAFIATCAKADRWPAPARVLDELPPRLIDPRRTLAREPKPLPPEIRAQLLALIGWLCQPDPRRSVPPAPGEAEWPALEARLARQRVLRELLDSTTNLPEHRHAERRS